MVDNAPKHVSIGRCRELLGAESSNLSDEAIEGIRAQADTLGHLLIDIWLDEQQRKRALPPDAKLPVRSGFGREKQSV